MNVTSQVEIVIKRMKLDKFRTILALKPIYYLLHFFKNHCLGLILHIQHTICFSMAIFLCKGNMKLFLLFKREANEMVKLVERNYKDTACNLSQLHSASVLAYHFKKLRNNNHSQE